MEDNKAWALKYRPLKFKDVLDQESVVTVLKNIIKNKKYGSPLLFAGAWGSGKTTLARIFARAVLCENLGEDFEPCNSCASCKSFLNNSNFAFIEIDAASNSGVDDIRKIRESASEGILGDAKFKVVLIDECHSISKQGNEALLKQLEECTDRQLYIFCTTSPEDMLNTVRSRCFEFNLRKNTKESIFTKLHEICEKESVSCEKDAIFLIAAACAPHVRDAIKNLEYLANLGEITKPKVLKHFSLDLEKRYLDIIKNIKDNLSTAMQVLSSLKADISADDAYAGLINCCLNILKLNLGINCFFQEVPDEIKQLAYTNFLLEELCKRNKYSDYITLESDLIIINHKLSGKFYVPEVREVVAPQIPVISEEAPKTEDAPPVEDTQKTLNRYKAYPPTLALMFEKAKNSNSIKSGSSVELNNIKDFKNNISKMDLKQYIETKKK